MHNTNLAVVAPGIAEALFATAIGLVAAIPAVLAYNKISTDLARFAVAAGGVRQRVQRHPVAPERGAGVMGPIWGQACNSRWERGPPPLHAPSGRALSMAFALNARTRRGRYRPLAEINVTPLVDVMLVLLIIFMVTAPLMTSGVSVDLPKTNAQPINSDSQPLTVSINAQRRHLPAGPAGRPARPGRQAAGDRAEQPGPPHLRARRQGPAYGRIMEVMGTITQGGFTKVALLAEQTGADHAGRRRPARRAAPAPRRCRPATPSGAAGAETLSGSRTVLQRVLHGRGPARPRP